MPLLAVTGIANGVRFVWQKIDTLLKFNLKISSYKQQFFQDNFTDQDILQRSSKIHEKILQADCDLTGRVVLYPDLVQEQRSRLWGQ